MFRKVKKRLIMLMLAMCLAMSPAYSFMMVQDPLAIVTTVNNFVQTLTYYKNQIQKTYDEYRRIKKSAEAISNGDWKEALRGVADLANQMNEWDIFGSEIDLLLESIASGNDGAVDVFDAAMNVSDAWTKMVDTFKNSGSINSMDDLFETTLSGMSSIEDLGKATAKTINTALYAVTDVVNPLINAFNIVEMREKIARRDYLIKQRDELKEVIEAQKESAKEREEKLTKSQEELNNAMKSQETTKQAQLSKQVEYEYLQVEKIEKKIEDNKTTLEKVNQEINTLSNEITEQQTNPQTLKWFEKGAKLVQEALEKTKLTEFRSKMKEVAYESGYGRN